MRGYQEISREWVSLAQQRWQKNFEGVQAMSSCRTVQEAVAAQTELARDNLRQIVENSRQIAESCAKIVSEAAQAVSGPKRKGNSRRLH